MVKEIRYSAKSSSSGATVAVVSRKGYGLVERLAATGGELFAIFTRALKAATVINLHMESQDAPKKRSLFKRWWFWLIIGIIIILIISGSTGSGGSSQAPTVAQDQGECAIPLKALQAEAKSISYKDLEKDPTSYNGQVSTFIGQVLEIDQNGNNGVMRLSVTDEGYGIWSQTDVIYVTYDGTTTPVQGDIVTVTGALTGTYTYTSEANYQITLPSMNTCGSDIQEASSKIKTNKATEKVSATPVSADSQPTTPVPIQPVTPVSPAPPVVSATWHTVYNDSDQSNTNTPAFTLQGTQQKIVYSCTVLDDTNPYSSFTGYIQSTQSIIDGYDDFANVVTCPTSNTTYEYSLQPGPYYLDLEPDNARFNVTVEDYY